MSRRPNPAIDARIVELSNGGRTPERQIATVLKREGHDVTPSGVHRALSRLGLAGKGKAKGAGGKAPQRPTSRRGGPEVPPPPPSSSSSPLVAVGGDDLAVKFGKIIASLERAAALAETDNNVSHIVQSQRAITQATALLARLTPAPPQDVNERPDMVTAAKLGREAAHVFFDRLLGAAS